MRGVATTMTSRLQFAVLAAEKKLRTGELVANDVPEPWSRALSVLRGST